MWSRTDLLAGPAKEISIAALEQVDVLERLELEGKLVDVPGSIDPGTEEVSQD